MLTLNITYHPALNWTKDNLYRILLLLTPNEGHTSVFPGVPIVGFKRGRNLKDMLVRSKLHKIVRYESGSQTCGSKICQVCDYINVGQDFTSRKGIKFHVRGGKMLNCNYKFVVYLAQCKTCDIQCIGSATTMFRSRFNNYKSCHRKHVLDKVVQQESFHSHFSQLGHNGMADLQFRLIDSASDTNTITNTITKSRFGSLNLIHFGLTDLTRRKYIIINILTYMYVYTVGNIFYRCRSLCIIVHVSVT